MERISYVNEIKSLNDSSKKYVLDIGNKIYESDNEQDIMEIIIKGYTEVDDPNMQLLYRIDLARALAMFSLVNDINVEIRNDGTTIKENYAAAEGDPDYEKDYESPDLILDVNSEMTMFSGINKIGYAKIYVNNKGSLQEA